MRLLTFRVELLEGFEVRWHAGKTPCLAVSLTESERAALRAAGGSETWDRLEARLPAIRAFILDGDQPRAGDRVDLMRIEGDRVRLTIRFGRCPIVRREYPAQALHDALRVADRELALEQALTGLQDPSPASSSAQAPDDDPERAAWAAVWADEAPPPKASAPVEAPIDRETFRPPAAVEPLAAETSPEPPKPEPAKEAPKAAVVAGPLRAPQIRLYVQALRQHGKLPDGLSEAARKQVMSHAAL